MNLTPTPDQASIAGACAQAKAGDVVILPAAPILLGKGGASILVDGPFTVQGADRAGTEIQLAPDGPTGTSGVFRITGGSGAVVENLTILPSPNVAPFAVAGQNGSRISKVNYNPAGDPVVSYFAYYGGVYGVIDGSRIVGGGGNNELVFVRGPVNSWQTPSSMGTADAVYIESCQFDGEGYLCDANSNSRMVVRFCDILSDMKVDGHGKASNSPPRGVRHFECYRNHWSCMKGWYVLAAEFRGGTGVFIDNVADLAASAAYFEDYGYQGLWPNLGNVYMTPKNYPIADQVGNGMDGGPREPFYAVNNLAGGKPWLRSLKTPAAAAIALYNQQMSAPGIPFTAGFTENSVVMEGRDLMSDMSGLPVPNCGRGTYKTMLASKPTLLGQGWWVTDQGSWNQSAAPGNVQGQLYAWNGASWALKWTPYQFPFFPLPSAA